MWTYAIRKKSSCSSSIRQHKRTSTVGGITTVEAEPFTSGPIPGPLPQPATTRRPSVPCTSTGWRSVLIARSYWIPGSYTPTASEKRSPFLRPLKNKVFQESGVTTIELYDLGTSTPLESNKSHSEI